MSEGGREGGREGVRESETLSFKRTLVVSAFPDESKGMLGVNSFEKYESALKIINENINFIIHLPAR